MPDQEAAVDLNELAMAKLRGFVEYSRDTLLYAIDQKSVSPRIKDTIQLKYC
jgi:hypothetical protein